eukprot:m.451990 g.451990  ORF g.451990 m.451990 type:complete len:608 (+) comp20248_c0_seq1:49-1872(+)
MVALWVIGGVLAIGLIPLLVFFLIFKRSGAGYNDDSGPDGFEYVSPTTQNQFESEAKQVRVDPTQANETDHGGSVHRHPRDDPPAPVQAWASPEGASSASESEDDENVPFGAGTRSVASFEAVGTRSVASFHVPPPPPESPPPAADTSPPTTPEQAAEVAHKELVETPDTRNTDEAVAKVGAATLLAAAAVSVGKDEPSDSSEGEDDAEEGDTVRAVGGQAELSTAPQESRESEATESRDGPESDDSWSDDEDDHRMKKVKAITIRSAPVETSAEDNDAALRRLSDSLFTLSAPADSRARSRTLGDSQLEETVTPPHNDSDPFAVEARARSKTEPPEPSADVFGKVRVELPPDVPLPADVAPIPIKLVKAHLREVGIHLWHPEYTDALTGMSKVTEDLIARVASATHTTNHDATGAVEYLRAFAFNQKLRDLRRLPGGAPLLDTDVGAGGSASDPFTAPEQTVTETADPFAASAADPFAPSGNNDGNATFPSIDPFASTPEPSSGTDGDVSVSSAADPFASSEPGPTVSTVDPFGETAETAQGLPSDPFGDGSADQTALPQNGALDPFSASTLAVAAPDNTDEANPSDPFGAPPNATSSGFTAAFAD